MARKRKRPDAVEMHEHQRLVRQLQSTMIKDEFPEVFHITISLTFGDFDEEVDPDSCMFEYSPESRAFFELKCPFWECIMGGFNFSAPVRKAVTDRLEKLKGTEKCPGWQDRERINKHRCYLTAHYEIHIQYKNDL